MRVVRQGAALLVGLGLAAFFGASALVAKEGLDRYQGAWLQGSTDCAEVFTFSGKKASFKKPIDVFAPAFIISGDRLRTPSANCRIKSVRPSDGRDMLLLDCVNAVAGAEVRALVAPQPDGSLKRFFNAQDTMGSSYNQCLK